MDFMNLNQSAHGDREFGFIGSRMRLNRKVIVGFWQDEDVLTSLGIWMRAACAWHDAQGRARSPALAIICAKWPSPRATRSKRRSAWDIRSTATAWATWSRCRRRVTDGEVDRLVAEYDDRYIVAETLQPKGRPAPGAA